ncbi:hypothetical protein AVEN_142967-2-1, partial [Araneus ventricosus]
DLMEVKHLQTVYNINVAIVVLLFINSAIYYIAAPNNETTAKTQFGGSGFRQDNAQYTFGLIRDAYRHSVLEQSTTVTLEGSDWTGESDVNASLVCLPLTTL